MHPFASSALPAPGLSRRQVLALGACLAAPAAWAAPGLPVPGYKVVRSPPPDPDAFTQGRFFHDGFL